MRKMTMTKIEALWEGIRQESVSHRIAKGEFKLVRLDPEYPYDIFAGMDGSGFVMLAVGVSSRPPAIDADTGALDYFRQQRAGGRWLMALRLTVIGLEQVFGRLCQDLVDAAACVPTEAALISLFKERLILWKRLFSQGTSGLLQKHQIKGLIAELLALETFIAEQPGTPGAPVASWTGPSGSDQDFVFLDKAVEIKGVSPFSDKVSIASAEQLDSSSPMELHVLVLRDAAPEEPGSVSLVTLTSRIEGVLATSPDALKAFRRKLLEAGYVEHQYYQSACYTLTETRRYAVSNGFPRITRSMLSNGISDLSYSILLTSIAPFQIKESISATL
jgi:hypothetical protein